MALANRKELTALLQANRYGLSLLDRQIAELGRVRPEAFLALDDLQRDSEKPYSYATEGSDKQSGILINATNTGFGNPYFGYVRVQSDAAFVATRLFACYEKSNLYYDFFDQTFSASGRALDLRLYDESNAKWLGLANNGQSMQNVGISAQMFAPVTTQARGGLELPAECTFPRNALIRVEAYFQTAPAVNDRVHVIFHGYKAY